MASAEGDDDGMDVGASENDETLTVGKGKRFRKRSPSQQSDGARHGSTSSTQQVPRARVYPSDSAGPWVVYFRRKNKLLNVMQITKDLTKNYSAVTEILSIRRGNKLRVLVSDLKQANEIAADQRFTLEYRVYIPAHKVEIEGVVTEESLTPEILEEKAVGRFRNPLLPLVEILAVTQLRTTSQSEGKKSSTPSASFRVTFSGSALPDFIELGKLRLPVRLFVPAKTVRN